MKYIVISLCVAALMALSGCSDATVMTPEYIDPADSISSEISQEVSQPSSETASMEEPGVPPVSSSETTSEVSQSSDSGSESAEITVTTIVDSLEERWTEGSFSCSQRTVTYQAGELAGTLSYDLLQMNEGSAADSFNAYWQNDMAEWESSVRDTTLTNAQLAQDNGAAGSYGIHLSASVFSRGGVISVTCPGTRISGEGTFSFMSNRCFDEATGETLSLWQLFHASEDEITPRILEALTIQAEIDGHTGLNAASLFAPADFSCGEGGFIFYLSTESGLVTLTVPYENFMDVLAYPLC